jgi:hypothetical protein
VAGDSSRHIGSESVAVAITASSESVRLQLSTSVSRSVPTNSSLSLPSFITSAMDRSIEDIDSFSPG